MGVNPTNIASLSEHVNVFEHGTLQTKSGTSVSSRLAYDVIGLLGSLLKDKEIFTLIELHIASSGAPVSDNTRDVLGTAGPAVLDSTGKMLPDAVQIIRDILRPESEMSFSMDRKHYMDQFQERAPAGYVVVPSPTDKRNQLILVAS